MPRDAPGNEDWAAVGRAVDERMRERGMSLAYVARETRLSPTTIRYIGTSGSRHNESTLVALSVVLGWRYDHLVNILHGKPEKNSPTSPAESHFLNQLHAEVGPIREDVAGLWDIVHAMDRKIDVMYQAWHGDTAGGEPGTSGV